MKKVLSLFFMGMLSSLAWAGYGILVNGTDYHAGTPQGKDYQDRDQYLVKLHLDAGETIAVYDSDNQVSFWIAMESGGTSAKSSFTESTNDATCNVAGCYHFYIKLKWEDNSMWCQTGEDCSPTTSCFGIIKNDSIYIPGVINTEYTGEGVEYMIKGVNFNARDKFQLRDSCNGGNWIERLDPYSTLCINPVNSHDTAYVVWEDGVYDVYLKMIGFENNVVYVGCNSCSRRSSVPSQCSDVLMQGFYWDSYAVSEDTPGTDKYGDTRWTTLQGKAGDIGAYFDLIWLPPSALATGTGYHPKQYSNQSGDWGSRAELQQLIKTLHNSGTKVVADMVVNHMDAQGAWCDLSIQNFGEYGIFVPDVSWISQDDEMNQPWSHVDTLAGECWGLASGPHEDAPWYDGNNESNYASARDWAHDTSVVQEMCRAYAKWMRTEIGYDGFRYDYCKGLHASHFDDYNRAGDAYISFLELWASNDAMKQAITDANFNTMVLDFQSKYSWVDELGKWGNYVGRGWGMMADDAWKKYAVVWLDSHDNFLRGNGGEFGGEDGKSMDPGEKHDRLMQANAEMLSMPGIPCVFYPHWYKYGEEIKPMINARHCAGVHNESVVKDESWDKEGDFNKGYQATIEGTNGFIVLQLGTKATTTSWDPDLQLMASGIGYSVWVKANNNVAPRLIVTPDTYFEDTLVGVDATIEAVGGTQRNVVVYYTIDGSEPTTSSSVYTPGDVLHFNQTTTLKVLGVDGGAQSKVQTYTYTYREPLKRGIQLRFRKPEQWSRVYFYAWEYTGVDSLGNPTSSNVMGAYPGQRIYQDQEGWYSWEFANDLDTVHFCINSGNECGELNVRSNDLWANYDVCYGWQDATDTLSYYEVLLDCETTEINPDFDLVISPESGYFRSTEEGQQVKINVVGAEDATIYFTKSNDPTKTFTAKNDTTFTILESSSITAYAVSSGGLVTPTYTNIYAYKEPQSGALQVKFVKPHDWKKVCLYAFTRAKVPGSNKYIDTPYPLEGNKQYAKWPGMPWNTFEKVGEDSVYSYTMDEGLKEIYVIFNIGSNKTQSQDIFLDEDACYNWSKECWRAVLSLDCTSGPVPTSLVEKKVASCKNEKFIYKGELYIQVGDKIYNVFGQQKE